MVCESKPLVSVFIACYNHQDFVADSISSVLQQSYSNIELQVVDDGSRDDSASIIEALSKKYGFKYKVQSNIGLTATLNNALSTTRGKYFVPFGSDDVMLPDRIEKQVRYMEEHPGIAICGGNILKIDMDGAVAKKQKRNSLATLDFDDIFLDRKPSLPAPTLFFRKKILDEVGGFDPDIRLEDLYIQLAITARGYTVGYLDEVLAYYRVHSANTYKDLEFMKANVLETYSRFSSHPAYESVKSKFLNSLLLKASKKNKKYAVAVLKEIPIKHYNLKTLRGILRLFKPYK